MSGLRILLPKLIVVLSLSLGQISRVVALLERFYTPSVARVMLTRRRRLEYIEFFTLLDRDGRSAAPIARLPAARNKLDQAEDSAPHKRYIPVETA